ncbi:granulocyte-macrophage colony-stimulating factor receptor subunit alpha-like [Sciurus carolinensis]|uniref:granulocyte-macrophage colony-stimulating factor receptor subunit alpha-like n=1 Tax=Sciurus carolinensis TaxID=30640 RepID=UPI001FB4E0B4|nr:granulocyte-macrophage colony-stimulating factor receptor subunit alpha-like [Sciurus carolinensis]
MIPNGREKESTPGRVKGCAVQLDADETECAQYVLDPAGLRVGCHFTELGQPKRTDNYFFLLNGTSSEAPVQFTDFAPLVAFRIEKYNPPANVTVGYDRSSRSHVVRWDNPRRRFDLASSTFQYELDVQRTSGFPRRDPVLLRGQPENVYLLPGSDSSAENTLRLRVKHLRGEIWSEWSRTLRFGNPAEGHGSVPMTLVVPLVGAATLSAVVLMFLCKRSSLWRRLFPPIPQVKGEVTGVFLSSQVTWVESRPPPDSQEPEEVLVVEESP